MSEPRRIQRQRTRGWKMPAGAVYVGRPTLWGNPWIVGVPGRVVIEHGDGDISVRLMCDWYPANEAPPPCGPITASLAKEAFEWWLSGVDAGSELPEGIHPEFLALAVETLDAKRTALLGALPELRGKDLACWCQLDQPCHADVLLELANTTTGE